MKATLFLACVLMSAPVYSQSFWIDYKPLDELRRDHARANFEADVKVCKALPKEKVAACIKKAEVDAANAAVNGMRT